MARPAIRGQNGTWSLRQAFTAAQVTERAARAIVARPPLVLADEPTGNLDPDLSREIFELFERFHAVGVTLMIATHDLARVGDRPHRTLTLSAGCLVRDVVGH